VQSEPPAPLPARVILPPTMLPKVIPPLSLRIVRLPWAVTVPCQGVSPVNPNYGDFRALLTALRLDHLETLAPLARSGMGFWDLSLWAGNEMVVLERQIHEVLFPHLEFEVTDYRRRRGLEAGPILPPEWRNARCDVLAL
jgi:hypothetical protein